MILDWVGVRSNICNASLVREGTIVMLDGQLILVRDPFKYFGSIVQADGEIKEDVSHVTSHMIKHAW